MNTQKIAAEYRLAFWAKIVNERKESGLNVKTFCESAGIHGNTYYYWQRKLREAACNGIMTQNLPTELTARIKPAVPDGWASCTSLNSEAQDTTLEIKIGLCRVTVDSGINTELLSRVCRVLVAL